MVARRQRAVTDDSAGVRGGRRHRTGGVPLVAPPRPGPRRRLTGVGLMLGVPGDPRTASCALRRTSRPAGTLASVDVHGAPMSASTVDPADPVFDLHRGGKIAVARRVPLTSREDLSLAYTPGVARVCEAIAADRVAGRTTTPGSSHTVAVVTDGSAVLGLGNIGPRAAMPVMEGKAVLFKQFGGVDAVPICLDTQDVDEIVAMVHRARALVRRDQPRGHLARRAASRSSAGSTRRCRHPGLPRRPARHRDRRAGRAAQRRDRCSTASSATCASSSAAPARRASRSPRC